MTWESGLSFFFAILVFGVTPGPGVFAVMARALVSGTRSCFMLALGMAISDILYLIAACFGLALIANQWSEAFTAIRLFGAAYLLYLAWRMWTAPLNLEHNAETQKPGGLALSFLQGFLISASNPKVILFYIAFLPTLIDLSVMNSSDIALASLLTLVALMLGLMLIAALASKARRWFRSEAAMKRLNKGAGSIMFGAAAYLASRHS